MGTKKSKPAAKKPLGKGTMRKTKGGMGLSAPSPEPQALLVPAVQKVRDAAGR